MKNSNKKKEITIMKLLLEQFLSNAYPFSNIKDKTLNKKLETLKKRYNSLTKQNEEVNTYKPHCIFELLVLAKEENNLNGRYSSFLLFIDSQVKSLIERTNIKFHPKLKLIINQMILSIDEELGSNFQYLNFFGEIFGLNFILTRKDSDLILIDIERKLPNGKLVDFVFKGNFDSTLLYVDFVSIHGIDVNKLDNNNDLIDFLKNRFSIKINDKTSELKYLEQHLLIKDEKVSFLILPIIWSNMDDLKPFKLAFKELDKELSFSQCTSILIQETKEGNFNYQFSTVSNILDMI